MQAKKERKTPHPNPSKGQVFMKHLPRNPISSMSINTLATQKHPHQRKKPHTTSKSAWGIITVMRITSTASQDPHLQPPRPRLIIRPHPLHGVQLCYAQLAKNEKGSIVLIPSRNPAPKSESQTCPPQSLCKPAVWETQSEGNERDGAPGRPKGHHTIGSYHQLGVQSGGDMPGWHSVDWEIVQSMPHPCVSSHGSTSDLGPIGASLHEDHAQYPRGPTEC